jgi:D-glycero-alpha-D-manno-heptose-7-phosphate kinase
MEGKMGDLLARGPVEVSAPCRVDMGGTLDISTLHYPLRHLDPCTFNLALGLRTQVKISSYTAGWNKVSSRGFVETEYPANEVPFDHPLGLMFAVAAYFGASGVHMTINSSSPPRSALGGSSVAAVALVAGFSALFERMGLPSMNRTWIARSAQAIESSVAGVPCGLQDQLAAAYGGVHAWHWTGRIDGVGFRKETVIPKRRYRALEPHLLLAYCGEPHASKDVNGKWVRQFLSGTTRLEWLEIVDCTRKFVTALAKFDIATAGDMMNREMAVRLEMTPEVLDPVGALLVDKAMANACGARFTGAGGGGCIWALGEADNILRLHGEWDDILQPVKNAKLLPVFVDESGILLA